MGCHAGMKLKLSLRFPHGNGVGSPQTTLHHGLLFTLHCFSCTILQLSSHIVSIAGSLYAMALSSSRGNRSKHLMVHWGPDPTHTDCLFLFFQASLGKAAVVFGREKEGDCPSTGSGRNSKSIYVEVADYVFWNNKDKEMHMH